MRYLAYMQALREPTFMAVPRVLGGDITPAAWGLYEQRDPISLLAACLIVAGMAYAIHVVDMQRVQPVSVPATVRLVELSEAPPSPPESMPKPARPRPARAKTEPPQPQLPKIETVPPLPAPASVVEAAPPTPTPVPVAEVPASRPEVKPTPQPAAVPPAPSGNPSAESAYQAKARAQIEKNKHYPEEALQMNMTGSVVVVYVIGRDGQLIRAEVEHSSGYSLLDQAALRAVRKARFDPIPQDAWVNLKEQTFRTRIDFTID